MKTESGSKVLERCAIWVCPECGRVYDENAIQRWGGSRCGDHYGATLDLPVCDRHEVVFFDAGRLAEALEGMLYGFGGFVCDGRYPQLQGYVDRARQALDDWKARPAPSSETKETDQ